MTSNVKPLKIGILGAARIAQKNALAIGHAESGCVVTAIASRSTSKAEDLVAAYVSTSDNNTVTIYGGETAYDDLVNSKNDDVCDALYIPLPTFLHKEWVCKALQSGKHVLVEKPAAINVQEYEQMLQVAKECGKVLMDGTMFPHHGRIQHLLRCAHDVDQVGTISRIQTSFTFLGDEDFFANDIRTKKDADPLGCIGDLGWYCIRMALLVFSSTPTAVKTVESKLNDEGVPIEASCFVYFDKGRVLFFHCGFLTPFRQSMEICGSKKSIKLDDFVLPKEAPVTYELHAMSLTANDLITLHDRQVVKYSEAQVGPVQEVLMWQKFASLCGSGCSMEANTMANISLMNQKVVNALVQSINQDGAKIDL